MKENACKINTHYCNNGLRIITVMIANIKILMVGKEESSFEPRNNIRR